MTRFLTETRERFLSAIAVELPPERFIEGYFFQAIRQGGVESGVAVIAARPERAPEPPILADAPPPDESASERAEDAAVAGALAAMPDAYDDDAIAIDDRPVPAPARYTVYSAKYRLTLKGAERGRWECTVTAEADAPLVTVDAVVRGVQRRSGDVEEPERMSGEEMVAVLAGLARR